MLCISKKSLKIVLLFFIAVFSFAAFLNIINSNKVKTNAAARLNICGQSMQSCCGGGICNDKSTNCASKDGSTYLCYPKVCQNANDPSCVQNICGRKNGSCCPSGSCNDQGYVCSNSTNPTLGQCIMDPKLFCGGLNEACCGPINSSNRCFPKAGQVLSCFQEKCIDSSVEKLWPTFTLSPTLTPPFKVKAPAIKPTATTVPTRAPTKKSCGHVGEPVCAI